MQHTEKLGGMVESVMGEGSSPKLNSSIGSSSILIFLGSLPISIKRLPLLLGGRKESRER